MRKWINGGLISAKLGRGTPQGHRADGDRGQNTLCSPVAGVGDREHLGETAGGAARTWVYPSPLGLHCPVCKVEMMLLTTQGGVMRFKYVNICKTCKIMPGT